MQTRLSKLDSGEFDAIILASAGLIRLELEKRIRYQIPPESILPAVGQGAVGIETREGDSETLALISFLNNRETNLRVSAERAFNHRLEGGCQVPIAAFALLENDELWLRGLVASLDGKEVISGERRGIASQGQAMGIALAEELLENGADHILHSL